MMPAEKTSRSFRVTVEDGVAACFLDVPGEPVNTFSIEVGAEMEDTLAALERDPAVRAVVLASGKPGAFIAGARIQSIQEVRSAAEAEGLSRRLQKGFDAVERFPKPIVAAIDGACLGGGLELALACPWRVASDDRKTQLGLPEVQLGLIPGGGGTQRLPRLVGVARAKDLVLTARRVGAAEALAIGLVGRVAPSHRLMEEALAYAGEVARNAPVSLRQAKRAIEGGLALPLDEALACELEMYQPSLGTKDRLEALRAFAEKRPPVFTGE